MNKFSNLTLTIKINKPVDEVWRSLVDWKGQSKWMLQTKVWSELDQDRTVKNGKGVLIFAFTGIFPKLYPKLKLGILDTMEVTNWKPPHLCEVMHIGRIIRGTENLNLKKFVAAQFLLARGSYCPSVDFTLCKTSATYRSLALVTSVCSAS